MLAQATAITTAATSSAAEPAIAATVGAWAQAWAAQDVDSYLAFYAPGFKPSDGQTRAEWEALRRARVSGPNKIEITISELDVLRHDDARASASFVQRYHSDRYEDRVRKTLEMVRQGERWQIVEERVQSTAAQATAAKPEPAPVPPAAKASTPAKAAPEPEPEPKPAPEATPAPVPATPAGSGFAAGLGDLQVLSYLGQPLRAEIDLVSLRSADKDRVNVRLASPDEFRDAGIDYPPALVGAELKIALRDGKPIVRVTTRGAVNEPFLRMLVEIEWTSGRLLREYTVLLDPPTYLAPPPAGAVVGPTPPAPSRAAAPAPPVAETVTPPSVPSAAAPAPSAGPVLAGVDYKVVQGDTLSKIADTHMHPNVTLNQMMVAIYRANREAFIQDNINLVRAGRILTLPDQVTVSAVDGEEARELVLSHMASFAEYRRMLAETAPSAPGADGRRAVEGPITAKDLKPKPAPVTDQVKLAPADGPKAGAPKPPAPPKTAAASEDDRIARERALSETQARVTELEKNVADLQKLVEIKNQLIAQLEKRAAEAQAAAAVAKPPVAAPKPAVEAPKPAPVPAKPKPVVEAPKPSVEAPKPAVEAPKPVVEAPKPAPVPAKPKPATKPTPPKPAPKPRPAPPPEPGLLDEYLGDPLMLGGLAGVIVLLIGYGAYAWRKKKRAAQSEASDRLREAMAATGSMLAVPEAAEAARQAAPAEEADPLAEADIYMAYGRDAQAEELLREALQKGANRPTVHSKLLQIYAKRHDAKNFEATALLLKDLVHGEGPEWDKAMALGRSIDPGNALYGQGEATAPAAEAEPAEAPSVDFDLDAIMAPGQPEAAEPESTAARSVDFTIGSTATAVERPAEADMTLDFDLGGVTSEQPVPTQAAAPAAPAESAPESEGLDFDLGAPTGEEPAATEAAPAEAPPEAGGLKIELSLEPEGGEAPPPKEAAPAAGAIDLSSISFDLDETGPSAAGGAPRADAKFQEVTTKLHLAKSFEEIGDNEGARELLNEVLIEGDDAQKAQAREMLSKLE